jgi:hypothetical protein
MRKLSIAVVAIAALATVVSVAYGTNVYKVHLGSTTVKGKGSKTKPIPTGLKFGFQVTESDSTKRATVLEKYAIGSEGLVANPKLFPKCAFSDMDQEATVPAKCNKALVGTGLVKNATGPNDDQSLSASRPCNLKLRLYNNGSGMIIRLDGGPPVPPSFESDTVGCLLTLHTAINAKFVKRNIKGVVGSDLVFSVPQDLKHPLVGLDNSIRRSDNVIQLKAKRVAGKRRGFYEKVGCKGSTRTVRATFTTERTATQAPQTFSATKSSKC